MSPADTPADRFRAVQGDDLVNDGLAYARRAALIAERLHVAHRLPGMQIDLTETDMAVVRACLRTAGALADRERRMQAYEAALAYKLARSDWNVVRVQWWIFGLAAAGYAYGFLAGVLQALGVGS